MPMSQRWAQQTDVKSLDEWYVHVNHVFVRRNLPRSTDAVMSHITELVGALSFIASGKKKPEVTEERILPRLVAWWMVLCGKAGVESLSSMLWSKYPGTCPYCFLTPHHAADCAAIKKRRQSPDWQRLYERSSSIPNSDRPRDLMGWQQMLAEVYPVDPFGSSEKVFARLAEEVGELAEAVRLLPVEPGFFVNEASDVFAWTMNIASSYDDSQDRKCGETLRDGMTRNYAAGCSTCGFPVCDCPQFHPRTFGRIAEMAPAHMREHFGAGLLTPASQEAVFSFGSRTIPGTNGVALDAGSFAELRSGMIQLLHYVEGLKTSAGEHQRALKALEPVLSEEAREVSISDESVRRIATAVATLEPEPKKMLMDYLIGIGAGIWAQILMSA